MLDSPDHLPECGRQHGDGTERAVDVEPHPFPFCDRGERLEVVGRPGVYGARIADDELEVEALHDLRIRAKNPLIADQIANNYRKADITPRQRAMLDFAVKVCLEAQKTSQQDFDILRGHGFSDDDIWDIAAISAFFALSNRMASVTEMRPNDEFYMMGRVPKA